jgi:2-polyprenyl-6-methoxyphenol hydroxylase-like FAD-dependent oxidoreductase
MFEAKGVDIMHFVIIGAGPVGLAAALLLSQLGHSSTVYEARGDIPNDVLESYPIGLNPRALHTMNLISPSLKQRIMDVGRVINSWDIYGKGGRMVAQQASTSENSPRSLHTHSARGQAVSCMGLPEVASIQSCTMPLFRMPKSE